MLDGRIDVHGTVEDLRSQGFLDDIAKLGALRSEEPDEELVAGQVQNSPSDKTKGSREIEEVVTAAVGKTTPGKLVKEEEREAERVKWKIYNTYLKAS
jgi:hypothetical protein